MTLPKATVVHSLAEARRAMASARKTGRAITLLSARGAALFAGCLWWREMIAIVRDEYPDVAMVDVLDCADDTAQAWAAVRIGLRHLVLERARTVPTHDPHDTVEGPGAPAVHGQTKPALVALAPDIDALRAVALARGVTLLLRRPEHD